MEIELKKKKERESPTFCTPACLLQHLQPTILVFSLLRILLFLSKHIINNLSFA